MKTIGLIGGMAWPSSQQYHEIINTGVNERLGGNHSAELVLVSVDFEVVEKLQHKGRWEELTDTMIKLAQRLEKAGADCVIICTNTMHKMADQVQAAVPIPLLHIADATAEMIQKLGFKKIGLLGTKFTMEEDFYKGRLEQKYGLEVLTPHEADRNIVHEIIYDELCLNQIKVESRQEYRRIMQDMIDRGAEGIILGCTEIMLLVNQTDSGVPVFDTTRIHADKAVEFALSDMKS